MNRKLLIIELNEFNTDLLRKGSIELGLSNIQRMLNMKHSKTFTENLAHGELDPWVQWVSIHIGMPHRIHKVTRLGELPDSNYLQLWEKLSKKNISAGIWGPMNASRSSANHCRFFLPDPWSFSESAFPRSLNKFLALPRYYAKNYIAPSLKELIRALSGTARFFLSFRRIDILKNELFNTFNSLIKYGINNPVLFCLFDVYSTRAFIKYKNHYDPQFSILFLNSIAHLQHHKWETESINKLMAFCLQSIDRILGLLFEELNKDESVIIMNALSQRNTKGENHFIYRQIKPNSFLELLEEHKLPTLLLDIPSYVTTLVISFSTGGSKFQSYKAAITITPNMKKITNKTELALLIKKLPTSAMALGGGPVSCFKCLNNNIPTHNTNNVTKPITICILYYITIKFLVIDNRYQLISIHAPFLNYEVYHDKNHIHIKGWLYDFYEILQYNHFHQHLLDVEDGVLQN